MTNFDIMMQAISKLKKRTGYIYKVGLKEDSNGLRVCINKKDLNSKRIEILNNNNIDYIDNSDDIDITSILS